MTPSVQELTRKNLTTLLRALSPSQERAAEAADLDSPKVSKWKGPSEGKDTRPLLEQVSALAAAAGVQFVPVGHQVVDPDEWRALNVLARRRLGETVADSGWGQL